MANTTDSIVLTTNEAKIILDWDDGHWYVTDVNYLRDGSTTDETTGSTIRTSATTGSGVIVPEWDTSYKYKVHDIVASGGKLYVSNQGTNRGNIPNEGLFWWKPIVDLTELDAITLAGKNVEELSRSILGGNHITDYYKKPEIDNLIIHYFNNVNARRVGDWTLEQIKDDYTYRINAGNVNSEIYIDEYMNDQSEDGLDQSLVDIFNDHIKPDIINQ